MFVMHDTINYLSVIRALTVNWMVNMGVLVANFIKLSNALSFSQVFFVSTAVQAYQL